MNNETKKFDLVSLGSCTMDMIFSVDDLMKMELTGKNQAEKKYIAIEYSSKLNVKNVKFFPGGSAANVACNLANIGFKSAFIGGVGDDMNGNACLEDMKNHKVDVTGVKIFKEESTAISIILITPWGKDRSILAYKGANNLFTQEDIVEDMLLSTKCFVWTSLTSDNGIGAIEKCIKLTKSTGGLIVGAPSISIIKNRLEDTTNLMKNSEIASMNEEELMALTGEKNILKGMKVLFGWGIRIVNITFGKEGQWLSDGKTLIKTRAPKTFLEDTTGAGDATLSGIIYGVLKKKSLQETSKLAAALSAMEIEATGVRVGMPIQLSELENFMNKHEIIQEKIDF
ncbi:MAG: carbohydrate kinase family protein [Candidatus Heimdallarchaeota archaeon]|nr:carbohydrate kinase family protein [Candidatus Heimdallarchaeota archaeon]